MGNATNDGQRLTCPDCGKRTRVKRDSGIEWRYCSCGWDVFKQAERNG